MYQCEQQINNNLSQFEEQEELNHIRWLLHNQTKRTFYYDKNQNDEEVSEWVSNKADHQTSKNKRLLKYLQSKKKDQKKKYTYLMDPFNEEENSQFKKYDHMPTYTIRKQTSPGAFSPKKITMKLPFPQILEQSTSCAEIKQLRGNVLPTIKRTALNFMRKQDKQRQKSMDEITRYPLLFRQYSERDAEEVNRKGRMMGCTKRQLKNHSFSCTKADKNIVKNSKLQQCLTFIK